MRPGRLSPRYAPAHTMEECHTIPVHCLIGGQVVQVVGGALGRCWPRCALTIPGTAHLALSPCSSSRPSQDPAATAACDESPSRSRRSAPNPFQPVSLKTSIEANPGDRCPPSRDGDIKISCGYSQLFSCLRLRGEKGSDDVNGV